jgi:glycerophosphoryl diester phosphodiesterase
MKIIAHRGSSFTAPENTLTAIRLAIEEKADGVEFDVRKTRDGKVAVIHDDNALRTTGLNANIRDMSMNELRRLDAGRWKGNEWRCETVPELSEVLGILPEEKLAFVEIKCGPEILPALAEVVPPVGARAMFVGFSLETMALTKQQFPGCAVLWNLELFKDDTGRWRPEALELIARARGAGIDGLGIGFCSGVNRELVEKIREAGLKFFVWTIDDVEQAKNLRSLNVDYLATNRPGWVRENMG